MSDTPTTEAAPTEQPTIDADNFFVSFHYSGEDNGMEKSGFDSRTISVPKEMVIKTNKEIRDIGEAMAAAIFQDGKKYTNLLITILNITRLPL